MVLATYGDQRGLIMGWEKVSAEREDSEESLVDKSMSTFTDEKRRCNKG